MNPRKPKDLQETMKTIILTPNSSVKSTTTFDNNNISESRDSFYFPGCKKDANCTCTICIESINATLDLVQQSRRSSRTQFSSSRPLIPMSPISFNRPIDDISTPKSNNLIRSGSVSPPLKSTARVHFQEKVKRENTELGYGFYLERLFLGLIIIFCLVYGISWLVSSVPNTRFSANVMKNLVEKSWDFDDLNGRLVFLENELEWLAGKKVSNCSSVDSVWKISQGSLFLNSRCVLYKSVIEEVTIWGWPLQSAGLLTTEYSSRSLGIISGRVIEWSNGETKYLVRKANSSWTQGKWSSSVVQFDPNTWILEYRRSFFMDNSRLVSAVLELLKFRLTREFEKMKQEFLWQPSVFGNLHRGTTEPVPT